MTDLAILVHGYTADEVVAIIDALQGATGRRVGVLSGSGRDGQVVGDILREAPAGRFEGDPRKALMFLNFSEEQMYDSMMAFPDEPCGIERPAFALPTEENVTWTLGRLLGQLMEHRDGHHDDD